MRHKPSLWHQITNTFDYNCDYSMVPARPGEIDFTECAKQAEIQGSWKRPITAAKYRISQGTDTEGDRHLLELLGL